jgi:hypothetical protein
MPRHSFVRMTKLTDVRGRVDYISNPKRQEHLYAAYSTVKPEFWQYLSEQAQHDFWKSNQKTGKCIEGRELIIALPESLREKDPDLLLQLFTETFRQKYGVQCAAALHHNKTMTNYHIHLVFADRDTLEKTDVKWAGRNMFFDEAGRHVRTKREILDADGNVRPGCRILEKGEIYDIKWFSGRKDVFKDRNFLDDVKVLYTDLINKVVEREEDKLQIFDASGPYLATKKIGKNNPREDEIRSDNQLRQEWNQTVDHILIAGGSQEEVTEFKREEVVQKVSESVQIHGPQPGLLAEILRRAITVLKEFLDLLMQSAKEELDARETGKISDGVTSESPDKQKSERPDSREAEFRFMQIEPVHQKLTKTNRKLYALQKQKETVQLVLDHTPKSIFHRRERKELQERIDGLERQITFCQNQLFLIPDANGFASVKEAEQEYRTAKKALEQVRRAQAEWDGTITQDEKNLEQPKPRTQKLSVLKQLAEKQAETSERNINHADTKVYRKEASL